MDYSQESFGRSCSAASQGLVAWPPSFAHERNERGHPRGLSAYQVSFRKSFLTYLGVRSWGRLRRWRSVFLRRPLAARSAALRRHLRPRRASASV